MRDNSIRCLEWAPGAEALSLVGDFSKFKNLLNISKKTYKLY